MNYINANERKQNRKRVKKKRKQKINTITRDYLKVIYFNPIKSLITLKINN